LFFLGGGGNRFIYVSEFRDPPPPPNLGRRRRARRVRRPRRLPRREPSASARLMRPSRGTVTVARLSLHRGLRRGRTAVASVATSLVARNRATWFAARKCRSSSVARVFLPSAGICADGLNRSISKQRAYSGGGDNRLFVTGGGDNRLCFYWRR
jgi:hypothetical protein